MLEDVSRHLILVSSKPELQFYCDLIEEIEEVSGPNRNVELHIISVAVIKHRCPKGSIYNENKMGPRIDP